MGKVLLVLPSLDPSPPSEGSWTQPTFPTHSCSSPSDCSSGSLGSRCVWAGPGLRDALGCLWGVGDDSCSKAPQDAGPGLQEHLDHPPVPLLLLESPALPLGRCCNQDLQTLGGGQNSLKMAFDQFLRCLWIRVPALPQPFRGRWCQSQVGAQGIGGSPVAQIRPEQITFLLPFVWSRWYRWNVVAKQEEVWICQ